MRAPLPIDPALPELLARLGEEGSAVVVAPPGSGKTTRLPPALLESGLLGRGTVWVLQPRRIAARAAARRIASELGQEVGATAGYVTRDESRVSGSTRIVLATEGVLTRKLVADPFLGGVAAVVLDEFHERSRHTDLVLAMLSEAIGAARPDLKLVVASATLDPDPVAAYLGRRDVPAPVVRVAGALHPLEVRHADRVDPRPLPQRAAWAALRAIEEVTSGDVLVFLPGAAEIRRAADLLADPARRLAFSVVPLHGDLPAADQDRALLPDPAGRRKVVLSTNVAETSLTIEGVTAVVDGGFARLLRFDPRTGLDRLELTRISISSASQRAGRAGRLRAGTVYRLYTADEERGMAEREVPELLRSDLAPTLLDLLGWAARPPEETAWFEAPPRPALERGLLLLRRLGAVTTGGFGLTASGRSMADLPLHPRLSAILLEAARLGASRRGALLAALLSERDVLASARSLSGAPRRDLPTGSSDAVARLELVEEAERAGLSGPRCESLGLDAGAVRAVLRTRDRLLLRLGVDRAAPDAPPADEPLLRAVLAGYPDRVGRRRASDPAGVAMAGGVRARLDPESSVRDAPLLVALDVASSGGGSARIRAASAVDPGWLSGLEPRTALRWDAEGEQVVAERQLVYEGLVLSEQPVETPLHEATAELLAEHAGEALQRSLSADPAFQALRERLAFLSRVRPDLGVPVPGGERLAGLVRELALGRRRLSELRQLPFGRIVRERLSPAVRRALDDEAPESLPVPTGRSVPLDYGSGEPVLAVKLQELFGLAETPRVARGRVPVLLHLLSPAGRPVQVTTDLRSFWDRTYPLVRKELRGRYPKHPWPDDPWNARPQRGVARKR